MAKKTKKSVKQIQEALLTNTGLLRPVIENEPQPIVPADPIIEHELMEKLELLARYQKTETKDLINKALQHFIKLKGIELEQAQKMFDK